MAERFRPAHHPGGGGRPPASRAAAVPPPNHAAAPPSAPTASTVRRNLFQANLTRRPTGPTTVAVAPPILSTSDSDPPSSPSATSAAETLRLDDPRAAHALLFPSGSGNDYGMRSPTDPRGGNGGGLGFPDEDIVIRDKNGEVELSGDPASPDVGIGGGGGGQGEEEDDEEAAAAAEAAAVVERERERERLAEAVRQHQVDQNSVPVRPEGWFFFLAALGCCLGRGVANGDCRTARGRQGQPQGQGGGAGG